MELTEATLEQHWMPFTNNREFKREPRMFVKASGMYYWNQHGEQDPRRKLRTIHNTGRTLPPRNRQSGKRAAANAGFHAVVPARPLAARLNWRMRLRS